MKTIRAFDDYPYETSFCATVLECTKKDGDLYEILLDKTLFFPEEGGQSPDTGTLSFDGKMLDVTDVQEHDGGLIYHTVNEPVPKGISVSGNIDWDHRFNNMQQHTGEHIFSGIVNRMFGYDNVGFHLSDREVTVDYNGSFTDEELSVIEHEANMAVIRDLPVECRYPSPDELKNINYRSKKEIEGAIRIVTIPGVDTCACCAPHVRTTGEIGLIKIISCQSHRGGVRIRILCGFRAIALFGMLQDAAEVVSREYSVPVSPDSFSEAITKRNARTLKLKERISDLQEALLGREINDLDPNSEDVVLFVDGMDDIKKRNLLNDLTGQKAGYCAIFDGNDSDGYSFIIASSQKDCREMAASFKSSLGAKGGGSAIMVQGHVNAKREQIESLIAAD